MEGSHNNIVDELDAFEGVIENDDLIDVESYTEAAEAIGPESMIVEDNRGKGKDAECDNQYATSRKRGRNASHVWSFCTTDADSHKLKSAVCKHCTTCINHHEKSESTKVHLNRCSGFRKLMNGRDFDERPDWYASNKKGSISRSGSTISKQGSGSSIAQGSQRSIKEFTVRAVTKREKIGLRTTWLSITTALQVRFSESKMFIWRRSSKLCEMMTTFFRAESN